MMAGHIVTDDDKWPIQWQPIGHLHVTDEGIQLLKHRHESLPGLALFFSVRVEDAAVDLCLLFH